MVETAIVLPVFLALALGSIVVYSWQLGIESAQFAALDGVQATAIPAGTAGVSNLLCAAGERAFQAANTESFLRGTTLWPASTSTGGGGAGSGNDCTAGYPNYIKSCPAGATPPGPTDTSMKAILSAAPLSIPATQTNTMVVCAWCWDYGSTTHSVSANCLSAAPVATDQVYIVVAVIGYKPLLTKVPFLGNRTIFYGDASQTLQEFEG